MKWYLIAGEASGDLHGSNLLKGLKAKDPQAQFRYWGGSLMAEVAPELVHDYKEGAVMGFTDVLAKGGKLLHNLSTCKKDILAYRPDAVVLIDYPGFNMKIAKFCHRHGLRVFYYIAPKTWASREGRNRALRQYVDSLFIVFPFEIEYFTRQGIPFRYAGNPLIDSVDGHEFHRPAPEDTPYIAVLPGSRKGEIDRMMPICLEVAQRLGCKVIIAGAPARTQEDYHLDGNPNVELLFGRTYDILKYAQAAIINSGTASLEAALIGTPQVVCWSTTRLTAFIASRILHVLDHVKYISLGNLIVDRLVFKELIQNDFTADKVCAEMSLLLDDDAYRSAMLSGYQEIRSKLGGSGASAKVAEAMISELQK